ncbi:MAG: isoamylase early set domain-containing protein [Micromonosporaceae bacterium]
MLKRSPMRNGKTRVTFSLPAQEPPGIVSVVGDFNGWQPGRHELAGRRNGVRSVTADLTAGTHWFRYLASGDVWFDEPTADQIDGSGSVIHI